MTTVMISYARQDARHFAGHIASELKRHGIDAWLDTSEIQGGAQWLRELEQAIDTCSVVLAVRSPAAKDSFWVSSERLYALNKRKPIIPLLPVEAPQDLELISFQPIDFRHDFEGPFQTLLGRLRGDIQPSAPNRRTLELAYLGKLKLEHKIWEELYTPMAGVGQMGVDGASDAEDDVDMVTVPTGIETILTGIDKHFPDEKPHPVEVTEKSYTDILDAIREMRQLVILGDPGSGKTTTLWRIAAEYAAKALDDEAQPLPVFVRLGEMKPGQTLRAHIAAQLGEKLDQHYDKLRQENRLLFLIDGLNELPAADKDWRAELIKDLRQVVADCQKPENNQVVAVTCRELDYTQEVDLQIEERVVIEPLNPIQIRTFVNNYIKKPPGKGDELFWALAGEEALDYWQRFQRKFDDLDNPAAVFWLRDRLPGDRSWGHENWNWRDWLKARRHPRSMLSLARNPYMLFMTTRVFTKRKKLPKNRGALFTGFVDYLLLEREKLAQPEAVRLKARLSELAYAMQSEQLGTTVDRPTVTIYLSEVEFYRASSANLLRGSNPVRFTHQLLQEYFAARKLDEMMKTGKPASDLWPPENWWEPTGSEETAILLAGLYSDDPTPVLEWLQDTQPELAARCALESGANMPPQETLDKLRTLWIPRLTDLQNDPDPRARAAVGRGLGLLKLDNRPGVGLDENGLPDMEWVKIPGGEFIYQENERQELDTFYMARYPVTYLQFQAFIDTEDGFHDERWWQGLASDAGDRELREQSFKYWNHPREMVNWYAALAFCRWWSWKLGDEGDIPRLEDVLNWPVRLPTEQEWEKAARGTDDRIYPWGDEFDASKANTNETGIGMTSAVGIFPQGASPYGVLDMSGNVWEWTLTEHSSGGSNDVTNSSPRVLRGGSWDFYQDFVRAAARGLGHPNNRNLDDGFRVVRASAPILP